MRKEVVAGAELFLADCLVALKAMPDNSVDSIVTDPPYGLSFMGKRWDYDVPSVEIWEECLRVLKPGGHLLAFAGTRTQHRMAVRIEDAGFEIRDMIAWVYGSGFPKSLDVSKAIDKVNGEAGRLHKFTAWMRTTGLTGKQINDATGTFMGSHYLTDKSQPAIPTPELWARLRPLCGDVPVWVDELVERIAAEREVVGRSENGIAGGTGKHAGQDAAYGFAGAYDITAPATEAARQWSGWGTALKPALEPITMARKPLGTCATNVLQMVESQLRERGVRGEILWKPESASGAARSKKTTNSGSTRPLEPSGTSAKTADGRGTQSVEQQSPKSSERHGISGLNPTLGGSESFHGFTTSGCENPLSPPTAGSAPAAESVSVISSPSTTSTAEEHSTENKFTGRSTHNCAEKDSRLDTESFAGIATGLTGSMGTAHISRDSEGFFLWPKGLPEFAPGSPLTVAANVLEHGTGALNIDGCRVRDGSETGREKPTYEANNGNAVYGAGMGGGAWENTAGRWPANLIHDGSDEVVAGFPQSSAKNGVTQGEGKGGIWSESTGKRAGPTHGDTGSAARFFYCAKASKKDRGEWNTHPTVKPTELMRYLCRLVTPPGGTVLDPFMGSGSTGKAALLEGFVFIGIEREQESFDTAAARIGFAGSARAVAAAEAAQMELL